jgi:hypothetical protein
MKGHLAMPETDFVLSTLVPAALKNRVEQIAADFDISRNEALRMALELMVKRYEEADRVGVLAE